MLKLPSRPNINGLLNFDLTNFPGIVYLAIIFFVSRIPFIDLGYSTFNNPKTDLDSLAIVNSAYLLRYAHVYVASRFPGSPLYEIINSFLIGGGWLATNTATMIISFLAAIIFGKILNILHIQNKAVLMLTFAFMPVIWINSTITMDYMWALMFLLLAFYLVLIEKFYYSAFAVSFAIGCRPTSVFMMIPLLYWMFVIKTDRKMIYTFLFTSFVTTIVIFSPVIYKYGFEFLKYYPREILFNEVFNGITTQLISGIAVIVLLIGFTFFRKIPEKDSSFNLSLLVIFIYSLLFIYHPSKPAYLIPIVPWGLILLSKIFSKNVAILLCFLLIINSIISVEILNDEKPIKFDYGSVLKNFDERKSSVAQSKEFMESLHDIIEMGRK